MTPQSKVLEAVNELVRKFQKHPYRFLYESDIQCQLFTEMRSRIPESITVPSSKGERYELSLVYSEYGSGNSSDRIDLVCLNPDAIRKKDQASFISQGEIDNYLYSLPIFVGIELKYVQMGYRGYSQANKACTVLQDDYEKLSNISRRLEHKLALCFFQSSREEKYFDDKIATSGVCAKTVESIQEVDKAYDIGPERIRVVNFPLISSTPS